MKRSVLAVVAVVVAILALAVVIAFSLTSELPNEADAFLSLIEQGRYEEAYQSTAEAFRHETSEGVFVSFISRTLLTDYVRASWSSRTIEHRTGRLDGTVRTKGGGEIPLTLQFVKEGEAWKILSLEMGDVGFVRTDGLLPVPSGDELIRLTNDAIRLLADAINGRNFDTFFGEISQWWRNQTTPLELHQSFALFTAQSIDLLPALEENPIYSQPPVVDARGVLLLDGYYPVEPKPLTFSLKYIHEEAEWKLLGVNVRL